MPELPEVETIRRGLVRAGLRGKVERVWRSRHKLRIGAAWQNEGLRVLDGATPLQLVRRGKYLIWSFEPGAGGRTGEVGLLVHLGMTGRLTVESKGAPRAQHTHFVLEFADGTQVRFIDPRRFGGLRAGKLVTLYAEPPLRELGPEPLEDDFSVDVLVARGGDSKRAIRDVLLDQSVVAGLGNIYVNEALYAARIHPLVAARRIRASAWERLVPCIRDVLRQGLEHGGTTLRDYRDAEGKRGGNQQQLRVYGRAGLPCLACGAELEAFVLGGRSGVFCPHEQARPRGGWIR